MMKRILVLILSIFVIGQAHAQTVETDLVGLGMKPELASYLATILPGGSVLGNNTYLKARNQANSADISVLKVDASDETIINSDAGDDIVLQHGGDANRLLSFNSSGDTVLNLIGGDGSTANQVLTIRSKTSDGSDNALITVTGGGGNASTSRGAYCSLGGNENSSYAGALYCGAGDLATGSMTFAIEHASSSIVFKDETTGNLWTISDAGLLANGAAGGNLALSRTGTTLALQEGTAASACMGTATLNGTTAVTVSTTCVTTASRIFLTRTSDGSGSAANDQVGPWATNIVNGTSFDIDSSDANDNATVNWIIFHEAA